MVAGAGRSHAVDGGSCERRVSSEPAATAAFARLCVIGFLAYGSCAICRTPLLPLLAQELGATPPMVGFVVGASTLTGIVLKLPAGTWSDLLRRRPLLVLGTIAFATMPFTYLGVASLGALVAVRFVHGAATAILGPVASASLSDIAPPARRATWLSTYSTVQGMVSDRVGRRSVIVSGLSLCSGAVWLVSLVEGPPGLVMAVAAYAVGVAVTTAATSAFITDLAHRARYGTAHGVFGSIYDVGDALGPIAAGVLVATLGYPQMFRVMGMVGFTISMVFLIATRQHPVRDVTLETR